MCEYEIVHCGWGHITFFRCKAPDFDCFHMTFLVKTLQTLIDSFHSITPSSVCGPYQGYNRTTEVVTDLFSGWQSEASWIKDLLELITSTASLITIAVTLA